MVTEAECDPSVFREARQAAASCDDRCSECADAAMDCHGAPLLEWACGFFSCYATRLQLPRVHAVFQAWRLS